MVFLVNLVGKSDVTIFRARLRGATRGAIRKGLSDLQSVFITFSALMFVPVFARVISGDVFINVSMFINMLTVVSLLLCFSHFTNTGES